MSSLSSATESVLPRPSESASPKSTSGPDKSRVKVAVRCRPFSAEEAGQRCIVRMDGRTASLLDPAFFEYRDALTDAAEVDEAQFLRRFNFDHCFWSHDTSHLQRPCAPAERRHAASSQEGSHADQAAVYAAVGRPMVEAALKGVSSSLFAYGQTGSGKTYTMLGDIGMHGGSSADMGGSTEGSAESYASTHSEEEVGSGGAAVPGSGHGRAGDVLLGEHAGVIPRVCDELLRRTRGTEMQVRISFLEVYNEQLFDLLRQKESAAKAPRPLKIREDSVKGVHSPDALCPVVASNEEVLSLLAHGRQCRTTANTMMNDESSRSHAIFSVILEPSESSEPSEPSASSEPSAEASQVADAQRPIGSEIHLVDLAGSERMNKTGVRGDHLREANCINRSLSTLGDVIKALGQNSSKKGRKAFVPYRNSVLTWILKRTLEGSAQTCLIAAVSPLADSYSETMTSLRFVQRAKLIVRSMATDVGAGPSTVIADLKRQIETLKAEVAELRTAADAKEVAGVRSEPIGDGSLVKRDLENDLAETDLAGEEGTDRPSPASLTASEEEVSKAGEGAGDATHNASVDAQGLRDANAALTTEVSELRGKLAAATTALRDAEQKALLAEEVLKLKHSAEMESVKEELRQAEQTGARLRQRVEELQDESQRRANASREQDLCKVMEDIEHETEDLFAKALPASISKDDLLTSLSVPVTPSSHDASHRRRSRRRRSILDDVEVEEEEDDDDDDGDDDDDDDDSLCFEESVSRSLTLDKLEKGDDDSSQMLSFLKRIQSEEQANEEEVQMLKSSLETKTKQVFNLERQIEALKGDVAEKAQALSFMNQQIETFERDSASKAKVAEEGQDALNATIQQQQTQVSSLENALAAVREQLSLALEKGSTPEEVAVDEAETVIGKDVTRGEGTRAAGTEQGDRVDQSREDLSRLSTELLESQSRETTLLGYLNEKGEQLEAERAKSTSLLQSIKDSQSSSFEVAEVSNRLAVLEGRVRKLIRGARNAQQQLQLGVEDVADVLGSFRRFLEDGEGEEQEQQGAEPSVEQGSSGANGDFDKLVAEIDALLASASEATVLREELAERKKSSEALTRDLVSTKLELSQTLPLLEDVIDVTIKLNGRIKELTKGEILPMSSGPRMLDHARTLLDKKVISRQEFVQILVNDFRVNEHQRLPQSRHIPLSTIAVHGESKVGVHRGVPVKAPDGSDDDSDDAQVADI